VDAPLPHRHSPLPGSRAHLLTDEVVASAGPDTIGVGDDVFFAGLFSQFYGRRRSQPIVRFGQIALMPDEQISVCMDPGDSTNRTLIDAYLVEARSWGGQSGSPAFQFATFGKNNPNYLNQKAPWQRSHDVRVLGLVHGHYDIPQAIESYDEKVDINAGIAIVVPAQAIIDLLDLEELVDEREQIRKAAESGKPSSTPDAAGPDESEFERFEDLTARLIRVPKTELDEKRKEREEG